MRISAQGRASICPYNPRTNKQVEPIGAIKPIEAINREHAFEKAERLFFSDTAENIMKVFVYGIGPIYVIYLLVQAMAVIM